MRLAGAMTQQSTHNYQLSAEAHADLRSVVSAHFSRFAQFTATWSGHPIAFFLAVSSIIIWVVTGPMFNFSDTWQLVINTGTTIITFLMVFLIQNTQNRDMLAVQIKLSELVLAVEGAKDEVAAIEDLTDRELEAVHARLHQRATILANNIEHRRARRPASQSKSRKQRVKSQSRRPS